MISQQFIQCSELTSDPIFAIDLNGVVLAANSGAAETLAQSRTQLQGIPVIELSASPADVVQSYLRRCAESAEPTPGTILLQPANSESIEFRCNGALIRMDSNEVEAFVALRCSPKQQSMGQFVVLNEQLNLMNQEIATRRRMESMLRDNTAVLEANNVALQEFAHEAENANRAKSDFLANMSHELRTPLNAVIGFSEGLLERVTRHPLNDHQIDRIMKIMKAGQHLLGLINSVLDIAKVEAGKTEVELSTFDLRKLVEEVRDMSDALLKDKPRVEFRLEVDDNLPAMRSDRDKIKQILVNLVGNAAKFTNEGSVVLKVACDEDHYLLSVCDTGIGIPQQSLHSVFGKFAQVRNATKDSIKGTGLGLAICQAFASLLQSTLGVSSVEGAGSTFTLSVPRMVQSGKATTKSPDTMNRLREKYQHLSPDDTRVKVLCVEDDVNVMQLLIHWLERAGYRPLPAFDGKEGLDMVASMSPDIITLDVMMPEIDGWEVLKRLKSNVQTRSIPVIMMTAIDSQEMGRELQADDYLVKPISKQRLIEVIERVLESRDRLCDESEISNLDQYAVGIS